MKRFEFVTHIPSPYRLHLFRVLQEVLRPQGYQLTVHFMSKGDSERPASWHGDLQEYGFPYTYFPNKGRAYGKTQYHLNPGLIRHLRADPPDILVLGGLWDTLTNTILGTLRAGKKRFAWLEGNTRNPGNLSAVMRFHKRRLLRQMDGYCVPGREGVAFIRLMMEQRLDGARCAFLPNLVDESRFSRQANDQHDATVAASLAGLGISPDVPLALLPARLITIKGIEPLLDSWAKAKRGDWRLLILGEGPLRAELTARAARLGLGQSVHFLPYVDYAAMPAFFRRANLFVLPSLADPNPLSVIEAMFSECPILVSDRVGNLSEALRSGVNGWGFSHDVPGSLDAAVQSALATTAAQRAEMGRASRAIAAEFWSSRAALEAFVSQVLQIAALN